jgi:hypothetical protein
MPKKTKIEKLPPDVRELISRLRERGRTLDEIMVKLQELDVDIARSTLARGLAKIDKIGERLRETRQIADALVAKFGERDDNKMLQLNIELMMPAIMQLLTPPDDGTDVVLDAEGAMFLATALQRLSKAQADDSARQLKEQQNFAVKAAKAAAEEAEARGLTADTVAAIKAAILGVPKTPKPTQS